MRITADRLKAIEKAIGPDTTATLVMEDDEPWYGYRRARLEVKTRHKNVPIGMFVAVHTHTPFEVIARDVVRRVQSYITEEEFSKVNWEE